MITLTENFSGKLAQPLKNREREYLAAALRDDQKAFDKISIEANKELTEKFNLLCQHYGISTQNKPDMVFYELFMALATSYVPGYQIEKQKVKKGAKTKWTPIRLQEVYDEVNEVQAKNPKHTVVSACKVISRRKRWKSFIGSASKDASNPAETIRQEYYKYKRNSKQYIEVKNSLKKL